MRLLRDADFSALWAADSAAETGYYLRTMAQAWLIAELFDSQFWVGVEIGVRAGPAVAFALVSGAFIDRLGGRLVLLIDRLVLAAIVGLTALLIVTDAILLWHIVLLGAVGGGMVAFGRPATNSLVPTIVHTDDLLAANSMTRRASATGLARALVRQLAA